MVETTDNFKHLKERVDEADLVLALKNRETRPMEWAEATVELADALFELAEVEDDANAFHGYRDVIVAYQDALTILHLDTHAIRYIHVTHNLIRALRRYGMRQKGDNGLIQLNHGLRLNKQLITNISSMPNSFERAMFNIEQGQIFRALADSDQQEKRHEHLENAVKSLREATSLLRAKEKFDEWAFALNGLGLTLCELSRLENDEDARISLTAAIDSFKSVSAFYRPNESPKDWATAQFQIGRSLIMLSKRRDGTAAGEATLAAVEALKMAGSLHSHLLDEEFIINVQADLAQALTLLATSHQSLAPKDALRDAVALHKNNLTRLEKYNNVIATALTQGSIGRNLAAYALVAEDKKRLVLREKAILALRASVDEELKKIRPQEWLSNLVELATTLHSFANELPKEQRMKKLLEVTGLYERARANVTKEQDSNLWAQLQQWQALAFVHLGEDDTSARGLQRIKLAELGFRQALTVFTLNNDEEKYKQIQNSLGHLLFSISTREDCKNPALYLNGAADAMENLRNSMDETTPRHDVLSSELHLAIILWRRAILITDTSMRDFMRADAIFAQVQTEPDVPILDSFDLKNNYAQLLIDWGMSDLSFAGLKHFKKAQMLFNEILEARSHLDPDVQLETKNIQETAQDGLNKVRTSITYHRKQQPFFKRLFWR